jgi:hypothetical protein
VSGRSAYASNARIEIEFRPFLVLQIKKKLLPFAINLVVPLAKSRVIIAGFTKKSPLETVMLKSKAPLPRNRYKSAH